MEEITPSQSRNLASTGLPSLHSSSSAHLHVSLTSEFAHLIGLDSDEDGNNLSAAPNLNDFDLDIDDGSDVGSISSNASSARSVVRGTFVFVTDPPQRKNPESKLEEHVGSRSLSQTKKEIALLRKRRKQAKALLYGSKRESNALEKLDEDLFSELEESISLPCEELFTDEIDNEESEDSKDKILTMPEIKDDLVAGSSFEMAHLHSKVASLEKTIKELKRNEKEAARRVAMLQASNARMKEYDERHRQQHVAAQLNLEEKSERCRKLELKLESLLAERKTRDQKYSSELQEKEKRIEGLEKRLKVFQGEFTRDELMNLNTSDLKEVAAMHLRGLSAAQQALTDKILEEKQQLEQSRTCVVCLDQPISIVLVPCGHQILCEVCAEKVDTCPLDRHTISSRIKAYGK